MSLLHSWNVSPSEAREIQRRLAPHVDLSDRIVVENIRTVVGVDNGYVKRPDGMTAYAAAVAFSFPSLDSVETVIGEQRLTFPYVPGLLSFREAPAIIAALDRLTAQPDVVLFDGQGLAHPRRFGLASHLGVVLDLPSIGCAKSRLVGEFDEPPDDFGAWSLLVDREEIVGAAVRTRPGHAPLFVSPGHKVSVESAVAIARACCRHGRFLPVPTEAAHDAVTAHTRPMRTKRARS